MSRQGDCPHFASVCEIGTVPLTRKRCRLSRPLASLLLLLAGCNGYNWTDDYQRAEQRARSQHRYLFIFYKSWMSEASNRMHGDVLPDPAVAALFRDTTNVLLEKYSSPEYARYMSKYGVSAAPAFVLVAPDGTYQVSTGFLPKERFIEFVRAAKGPHPDRPPPPLDRPPPNHPRVLAP